MKRHNPRQRAKIAPGVVLTLGLILLGVAYFRAGGSAGGEARVGTVAPAFAGRTLGGANVRFPEDYRGKLVFVDFWATWCPPCRGEIPHIRSAAERLGPRGVVFLGIPLDAADGMSASAFSEFVRTEGVTWPQVFADGARIAGRYGVSAVPTALLVDGDTGKVLEAGAGLRGAALIPTIEKHLQRS